MREPAGSRWAEEDLRMGCVCAWCNPAAAGGLGRRLGELVADVRALIKELFLSKYPQLAKSGLGAGQFIEIRFGRTSRCDVSCHDASRRRPEGAHTTHAPSSSPVPAAAPAGTLLP